MWKAWTHKTSMQGKTSYCGVSKDSIQRTIRRVKKGRSSYLVRKEESNEREDTSYINTIYSVSQVQPKVVPITQKVNGREVEFEVDIGCEVKIISKE